MKIERKRNAVKGTLWGLIYRAIQIVFPFIIRTIFIHSIGVEYLGLNSLFTSLLQVLNLAELGVSGALVFSMYRPIVENNAEKICQLMNLYRKYYRIIGFIVLTAGVMLIPVLPNLISGDVPEDINLYVIYLMHLLSTVLSYLLFAYRNSLFEAHQRIDIITIIQIIVNSCVYICQALALIIIRNYYVYLSLAIAGQIGINLITAIASKKFYPAYVPKGQLPEKEKKIINQKVRDLFTAKIGGVINNAADSIVISAFIGLEVLAVYQNYYYIIAAIMSIFSVFFAACTAGIGNSLIVRTKEDNRTLLYNINHIVFLAINICCACFVSMCNPFMNLWVGENYELPFSFVILFAVYLFAEEAPRTLIVFKDAGGIWRHDRFRPLVAATVNVTLNLIMTPAIGLYGIIISTIVALICIAYPWLIINIDKRLFKIDIKKYVVRVALYIAVIIIATGVSYVINNLYNIENSIMELIARFFVSAILSTTIFMLAFWKTSESRYVMSYLAQIKDTIAARVSNDNNRR